MAAEIFLMLDRFARVLPVLRWLPSYEAGWFRADVIAGLTLWGILVPEGIAYAGLAGACNIKKAPTKMIPLAGCALLRIA
jgi:sulfate permease, SulP family